MNIIDPLRPKDRAGWETAGDVRHLLRSGYPVEQWYHPEKNLGILTAVEVAKDDDGIDRGPEWHISISKPRPHGGMDRCSAEEAKWVLGQFGMDGAEEDNHVAGGKVRNFWRAVADRMVGLECACKENEPMIREGDFDWRPTK